MRGLCTGFLLCIATAHGQKVVALDGFHNNESKMADHYQWDGVRPGGFSELGKLLEGLGAELRTVRERVTPGVLAGVKVFIIVDPDTPAETIDPQYIVPPEIAVIEDWVRAGGAWCCLATTKATPSLRTSISSQNASVSSSWKQPIPRSREKGF